jgi:hypothetical protein
MIDGNVPRSGVSAYLTQRLAMEEEFDIQKILDAGHLIVDCLPAFLVFHKFLEADL